MVPGETGEAPFPFFRVRGVRLTAGPFKFSRFLAILLNLTIIRMLRMVRVTIGPVLSRVSLTHKYTLYKGCSAMTLLVLSL